MSSDKHATPSSASEHLLGRVKWFNNKAGYGFITITDGSRSGTDVFVHHSAIDVENQQYKYLVQGEYVEFDLIKVESEKHEWQASSVSGIKGGKLMCETRFDLKIARNEYKSVKPDEPKMPRQRVQSREGTENKVRAPRESTGDGNKKEWTVVGKNTKQPPRPRKTQQQKPVQSD
jgi:CspA family cold shock protein